MDPDGPSAELEPRVWIVVIASGSAETVVAVADTLRMIAAVTRYGGDHESSRLRVEGAEEDAVKDALRGFDRRLYEIVHPVDWATRVHRVDFALLSVARLVDRAALTITRAVTLRTSALAPDVRGDLVNALVAAFPDATDLDLVFDLHTGNNPGMTAEGRPLRSHYNNVVGEMLKSSDRFDRFICGTVKENPGNGILREVIAAAFDQCDTCGRQRVKCEAVR